ncbi:TetR/AcrR family transcriptional regulator [Microbacterium terricola]|uniref:TetR family transcriptional regulator n=1 Tax=Microbacterium terricola TaxID=344163 RepID=A0ABM8E3M3_9MICO|nr:TetR/AcrR family transcriptional regulator [Microbacterium terricola]UYK39947.1 TetR/AcrR family transcriptional regulator [Microbacterium terricola]BDV32372.1 TetR family transcriptional regulator [Microbacterium terricola]
MEREDPRWTRSRAALIAAVTTLLDEGRAPSITDIVATAGVSRPTFYQHFGDVPTACGAAGLERLRSQFESIPGPVDSGQGEDEVIATMTRLLEHLLAHRVFYCAVLNEAGERALTEGIVAFLVDRIVHVSPFGARLRARPGPHTSDRVTALAAGLVWLIIGWLTRDEPEPAAQMAARVIAVISFFTGASDASA